MGAPKSSTQTYDDYGPKPEGLQSLVDQSTGLANALMGMYNSPMKYQQNMHPALGGGPGWSFNAPRNTPPGTSFGPAPAGYVPPPEGATQVAPLPPGYGAGAPGVKAQGQPQQGGGIKRYNNDGSVQQPIQMPLTPQDWEVLAAGGR
jgi:hypothetical protein